MRYLTLCLFLTACGTPGDIDEFNRRWAKMDKPVTGCETRAVSQTHYDIICR